MENPEGVLNLLDEFAKLKPKEIPIDLEEYLSYVAKTGDPVYQWSLIKTLYRQKLINVITEFFEMCPVVEIPRCPNVEPFNYETMKNSLLKRFDSFSGAPFTIQRITELLTTPRKQYNRVDKYMRAIEKNIWVVSTREPGARDTNTPQDTAASLVNGVTPRVCVTVKHPKRLISFEERIKSTHSEVIDSKEERDDEGEEVDKYEQMDEEVNAEIMQNNKVQEPSLQCTSVKDLIEKYENGTFFSIAEEKADFEEKLEQLKGTARTKCDEGTLPIATAVVESEDTISSSSSSSSSSSTSSSSSLPPPPPQQLSPPNQATIIHTNSDSLSLEAESSESPLDSISEIPVLMGRKEVDTTEEDIAVTVYKEIEEPQIGMADSESKKKDIELASMSTSCEVENTKSQDSNLHIPTEESQPVTDTQHMEVDTTQVESTTYLPETPEADLEQNFQQRGNSTCDSESDVLVTIDVIHETNETV